LLSSAFLWVYGLASPLAGYLGDRLGHRRVVLFSLLVWSAVTLMTGLARSFQELVAARALMGLSEACYIPAALALIASHHSERTRARAVGIHQSGIYFGIVLGGAGGGWMGEHHGWRPAFYLLGAIGVAYGLVLYRALANSTTPLAGKGGGFWGASSALFRVRGFSVVLFVFAAMSLANWLVYTWLPLFLYERFSMSLAGAGFAATFYIQGAAVVGILAGGLAADVWARHHPKARVWTQSLGLVLAAPFLILSGVATTPLVLYVALIVFGLGRGIYDSNVMPVLCRLVGDRQRATGYGLLNFAGVMVGGVTAYAAGLVKATVGLAGALEAAGALLLVSGFVLLATPQPAPRD
jgi:MFS family permease